MAEMKFCGVEYSHFPHQWAANSRYRWWQECPGFTAVAAAVSDSTDGAREALDPAEVERVSEIYARVIAASEDLVIDPPALRPYRSEHNMRVEAARRDFARHAIEDVLWLVDRLAAATAEKVE